MKFLKLTFAFLLTTTLITSCSRDGGLLCTRPNGEQSLIAYTTDNFTGVDLQMDADVVLIAGSEYKVEVQAADNIHEILVSNVSGNELTLRTERGKCIRGKSKVTFYVTCPSLESITLAGSGDMINEGVFSGEALDLRLSGSGNIDLDGFDYQNLMVTLSGSGNMDLENFKANDVELKTTGSGNVELTGVDFKNIDAKITGSGKTSFQGEELEYCSVNVSGSGSISAPEMQVGIADVSIGGSGTVELFVTETLDVNITGSGDVYYYGNPSLNTNITGSGKVTKRD